MFSFFDEILAITFLGVITKKFFFLLLIFLIQSLNTSVKISTFFVILNIDKNLFSLFFLKPQT